MQHSVVISFLISELPVVPDKKTFQNWKWISQFCADSLYLVNRDRNLAHSNSAHVKWYTKGIRKLELLGIRHHHGHDHGSTMFCRGRASGQLTQLTACCWRRRWSNPTRWLRSHYKHHHPQHQPHYHHHRHPHIWPSALLSNHNFRPETVLPSFCQKKGSC